MSRNTVDLGAVRAARARLDALAHSQPERVEKTPQTGNTAAWLAVLEQDMAKNTKQRVAEWRARRKQQGLTQIECWLSADVLGELDRQAKTRGLSRSDMLAEAVRLLEPLPETLTSAEARVLECLIDGRRTNAVKTKVRLFAKGFTDKNDVPTRAGRKALDDWIAHYTSGEYARRSIADALKQ